MPQKVKLRGRADAETQIKFGAPMAIKRLAAAAASVRNVPLNVWLREAIEEKAAREAAQK